jgi:hypothetical protein
MKEDKKYIQEVKQGLPSNQTPLQTSQVEATWPLQLRYEDNLSQLQEIAMDGTKSRHIAQLSAIANGGTIQRQPGAEGNLPAQLQSGIESMSGMAMDDVRVHYNSSRPAQLQAHAFAQGNEIHLAPGQEKHLPHEAWHVVQQKQGRVKPTLQTKGVAINDDHSLEKEADTMGEKAAHSAAHFHSGLQSAHPTSHGSIQRQVVQRVLLTNVTVINEAYLSQPHNKIVYRMIVSPDGDEDLRIHIERAQAFASAGSNKQERLGLLFQYVDGLPKNEEARNAIYTDTGEKDNHENAIHEAYLGDCLNGGAACRELSAFLQLLLAEEGIRTNFMVGTVGGLFNAQRHAWLQIQGMDDDIVDPTLSRVGMKPQGYIKDKVLNTTAPTHATDDLNWDQFQEAAYKTKKRGMFDFSEPTLREKAEKAKNDFEKRRILQAVYIIDAIKASPALTQLEIEGTLDRRVIPGRSLDTMVNEIIPSIEAMSAWPTYPNGKPNKGIRVKRA